MLFLDVDDIIEDKLLTYPVDEQNDIQEKPKINVLYSQKATKLLETFWLQQDGDAQDFIRSLQRMKDGVRAIRTNHINQPDTQDFSRRV